MKYTLDTTTYLFSSTELCIIDPEIALSPYKEAIEKICQIEVEYGQQYEVPSHGWADVRVYTVCKKRDTRFLEQSVTYLHGQLHGPVRYYYPPTGSLKETCHLDDTVDADKIASEAWYLHGVVQGKMRVWSIQGILITQISYENGIRSGRTYHWSENGTLVNIQEYKHGQLHGTCTTFHPTSKNIIRSQNWKQGMRHGVDTLYHPEENFLIFCDEWHKGIKTQTLFEDLIEKNLHAQTEEIVKAQKSKVEKKRYAI